MATKKVKFKPLYVVMYDGQDGPLHSYDTGNPWTTLKAARYAIKRVGVASPNYYIVKFAPERRIGR